MYNKNIIKLYFYYVHNQENHNHNHNHNQKSNINIYITFIEWYTILIIHVYIIRRTYF